MIAAILTLIGYSMNDTIVVFDRIRENLATEPAGDAAGCGESSDQPDAEPDGADLGPDVPDGAESVYLFGGEVLHGFSFALVIGILIGTYSSIAVAAPMLVAYQDWRSKSGKAQEGDAARQKAYDGKAGNRDHGLGQGRRGLRRLRLFGICSWPDIWGDFFGIKGIAQEESTG